MTAQFDKSELTESPVPKHGAGRVSSRTAARIAWAIFGLSVALVAFKWLLLYLTPSVEFREEQPVLLISAQTPKPRSPVAGCSRG